jgi:undecaprenyl-diphosphatase
LTVLQAIILGAVQGLAEFIPVSSSAHLAILPQMLHWNSPGLAFDVALHLGTLLALAVYFWREWRVAKAADSDAVTEAGHGFRPLHLALSCAPAVVAGMLLEYAAETVLRAPMIVGPAVIVMGLALLAADRLGKKVRSASDVTVRDWFFIGLAQALAIAPGVSRSGVTIAAGLLRGFGREAAARFSFTIGAPLIFGAAVYELRRVVTTGLAPGEVLPFIVGVATAAVVGYFAISFLLRYLKTRGPGLFVLYRIAFGSGVIAWSLLEA